MAEMSWFACYPEKWLGALAEMKPDVGYVYVVLCLRMYEKRGPIPDTNEAIGRRIGYRPTHIARIVENLISLGKLQRTADGRLTNAFCEKEMAEGVGIAIASVKKLSRAGKKSAEKRQQNQSSDPTHLPLPLSNIESVVPLESEARTKRTRTRTAFPVGWCPETHLIRYASERGFSETQVALMFEAFGNHHTSRGNLMVDWDAAWRTWVNNEIKFSASRRNGISYREQKAQKNADIERRLEDAIARERNGNGAEIIQSVSRIGQD